MKIKKDAELHTSEFCARLREVMDQQGMTAAKLARLSSISLRAIIDYSNGTSDVNPRPSTVAMLANALGVTFNWLAHGKGSMADKPSRPYIAEGESGANVPAGSFQMPPPRGLMTADTSGASYGGLPPMDLCIAALARHLSIEERIVRDFVVAQMTRRK